MSGLTPNQEKAAAFAIRNAMKIGHLEMMTKVPCYITNEVKKRINAMENSTTSYPILATVPLLNTNKNIYSNKVRNMQVYVRKSDVLKAKAVKGTTPNGYTRKMYRTVCDVPKTIVKQANTMNQLAKNFENIPITPARSKRTIPQPLRITVSPSPNQMNDDLLSPPPIRSLQNIRASPPSRSPRFMRVSPPSVPLNLSLPAKSPKRTIPQLSPKPIKFGGKRTTRKTLKQK